MLVIAIDTNIAVRVFIDDLDATQIHKARDLVKKAKNIYLTQIVLVEMAWVFARAYQLTKHQIVTILEEINQNSAFVVEQEIVFQEALTTYKNFNIDFSDCMILASAKSAGIKQIYTFDEKFARLKEVAKL